MAELQAELGRAGAGEVDDGAVAEAGHEALRAGAHLGAVVLPTDAVRVAGVQL